jgi:hypothetical protein
MYKDIRNIYLKVLGATLAVTVVSWNCSSQTATAQSTSQLSACQNHILSTPAFAKLPTSEIELDAGGTSPSGVAKVYWHVQTRGAFGYCQVGPAPSYSVYRYNKVEPSQSNPGSSDVAPASQSQCRPVTSLNPELNDPKCWINNPG